MKKKWALSVIAGGCTIWHNILETIWYNQAKLKKCISYNLAIHSQVHNQGDILTCMH